ncbi:hypothetical protein M988_2919 [Hafnia paralvei ATCC 29927]|uniref:autotransporter outer membrane beta-barrel domain-containing protein n=1 Tax=Hafnia paralvei TaxID=546367 RepID=UPI0007E4647F|nr:autotransporter outer membrane beta-barrel domain-containing protein [Hafnia paralvei]MDU1191428.1 autotransporter outer membrane beta-barrel domain-containing protein [Enterobacteriaceae bacterium]MDU1242706.1 autotransporter outer membrane beta-barrel domain-containing protein [Enterobacteriaceae bacterium]OAT39815.1 hypothetical protein M988_2919 [Hafnia paralvei ATCC 29927]HCU15827.1 autotransporter outer membrane beta-barrel domain-containing protein [Hafnia paralvei]
MHQNNKVAFVKSALAISILLGLSGNAVAYSGLSYLPLEPNSGSGDTAVLGVNAYNFNNDSDTATLGKDDSKGNVYFNPAPKDHLQRTLSVHDLDLSNYYINFSYNKEQPNENSSVLNLSKATLDFIESGNSGSHTNIAINLKDSVLNGVQSDTNYDNAIKNGTAKQKNYAKGYGVYIDGGDSGTVNIDIQNSRLGNEERQAGIYLGGASDAIISINQSTVHGNIDGRYQGNPILPTSQDMTVSVKNNSAVHGSINSGKGTANIAVTDGSKITGNIDLRTASEGKILLGDDVAANHVTALIGNGHSTLTLGQSVTALDGSKFSGFDTLNVEGKTSLSGGFTDANTGLQLSVTAADMLSANVNLSESKLSVNGGTLKAESIELGDNASLTVSNGTLQTSSNQLFNEQLGAEGQTTDANGFNANGQKTTLDNSTLALSDSLYNLEYVKSVNSLLNKQGKQSTLIMLGKHTTVNGQEPSGNIGLDDAASVGGTILAGVTATSDKNEVIIGGIGNANAESIANGISVKNLQLGAGGAASVKVQGQQTLTLIGDHSGSENTDLITTPDGKSATVDVSGSGSTLQLGHASLPNATGQLHADVNLNDGTSLNVAGGSYTITGENGIQAAANSRVTIENAASLSTGKLHLTEAELQVNGSLRTDNLTAGHGSVISVGVDGKNSAAGTLSADNVSLNGATLFLDPEWQENSSIGQASQAALKFTNNLIDGSLVAGKNSLLSLGDLTTEWARAEFAKTGLRWSEDAITAALAINAPQKLDANTGGIRVDGALGSTNKNTAVTNNSATFGDNSLLMVNGDAIAQGSYALSSVAGTLDVSDGAKLYISNAKANTIYNVIDGFSNASSDVADNGWNGANLLTNHLLTATRTWDESLGQVKVTTGVRAAADALPGVTMSNALDTMVGQALNDTNSNTMGIQFLSRAIDTPNVSAQDVVKTINSASQIAVAGGVQNTTLATGMSAVNAILDHTSIINQDANAEIAGANLWANVLYGNNQTRDFGAGSFNTGNSLNFYGLVMGADISHEISAGSLRSGFAFNAGKGNSSSKGDFNYTKNNVDFWGVSLYENWSVGNFNVTADLGYSQNSNTVKQNLSSYLDMGSKLKADIDSKMLTAGLTGEYLITTSVLDIVPHVGMRYAQLKTKGFDTKAQTGGALFNTAEDKQDLWQFPVGVRLNKTFTLDSGWSLSPQADLSIVPVTGDTNSTTKIRAYGIDATDSITSRIVDDTSFAGQFGVKTQKDNITLGINYNLDASQHQTGQGVAATFNLKF